MNTSLTNDLTIEQLERIIANHEAGMICGVAVYRQLLATMQREAKLREALKVYADFPNDAAGQFKKAHWYEVIDAGEIAREALSSE